MKDIYGARYTLKKRVAEAVLVVKDKVGPLAVRFVATADQVLRFVEASTR